MPVSTHCHLPCIAFFLATGVMSATVEAAQGNATMSFRYRNTANGQTMTGSITFQGAYWEGAGAYCSNNHLDPDGNRYGHAHLPHTFPFVVPNNGDTVTAAKSDWAWDAYYTNQTRKSGSTFAGNCFWHCAGSPTVVFKPGWEAFTTASTQCASTNKVKSYGDASHCIRILETTVLPESASCVILKTSEKNASSGIYEAGWGPIGINANKPVRKRK